MAARNDGSEIIWHPCPDVSDSLPYTCVVGVTDRDELYIDTCFGGVPHAETFIFDKCKRTGKFEPNMYNNWEDRRAWRFLRRVIGRWTYEEC